MGIYKLGYLNNLDCIGSWSYGKAAYDRAGATILNLDSTKMCRAIGKVSSVSGTSIDCTEIINYPNIAGTTFTQAVLDHAFESSEFRYGFVRFLSGSCRNKVYKITGNDSNTLTSSSSFGSEGVTSDDYFEVVPGSCTFDFPTGRNPINRVFKRNVVNRSERFPFTQGGIVVFEGYTADDFVLLTHLTTPEDTDRLELILNHALDYVGFDGPYSYDTISGSDDGLAPMILETGIHDVQHQYVVYINDYKIIRDAKYNDKFFEIMIHFMNYSGVIYRGV